MFRTRRSVLFAAAVAVALAGTAVYLRGSAPPSGVGGSRLAAAVKRGIPSPPRTEHAASGEINPRFAPSYALGGATFTGFVSDSYAQCAPRTRPAGAAEFYRWLDAAYAGARRSAGVPPEVTEKGPLGAALDSERVRLAAVQDPLARARRERQVAAWAHRMVKKAIPRFSLERGFEFYNMAHGGQRQCYSQSVLIAGMLQRAGIPAGVVMVWKSLDGVLSNNGHAVVVARLASGRHLLVDASDAAPFPRQQGLFVRRNGQYQYVTPLFAAGDSEIVGYRLKSNRNRITVGEVCTLDLPFLRSQFYYYRGERAPGGAFDSKKTMAGLSESARRLRTATQLCPENPLAVYMLGRVYQRQGRRQAARERFTDAYGQYRAFGYVPSGTKDAFALVTPRPRKSVFLATSRPTNAGRSDSEWAASHRR
ncbi:MAG: hypothetical protein H7Z41_07035 [Cytophagales bacterium]|nr:hypothetical protein [Armatimonadota bacterium]